VLEAIESVRERLGPAPRDFDWLTQRYLRIRPPHWMNETDELREIYRRQDLLLREGDAVWASLVQANTLAFARNRHDCAATVVFAPDHSLDATPERLEVIASKAFALKNTSPHDAEIRRIADMVTSETERAIDWKLPEAMTGGCLIRATSTMVIRKHMPDLVLNTTFFPLLVHPDTHATMIVPSRFWPE
jgi:hypothetical protein